MSKTELNSNTVYVYIQTYQLAENYLMRALESIRKQTYTNFRCLIYDNCSDENIRTILQEYVKEDRRFSVTFFDNTAGHIIAWKYGIPEILHLAGDQGGYFCRVDADDELEPDSFERMITYMNSNDLDMAASGSTFIEADTMRILGIRGVENNIILEGDMFEKYFPMYYHIMRTHWGKIYKIDVIKKMNLSNLNIVPYGVDTLFVREALLNAERVGIVAEPLYKYYLYSDVRDYNIKEGRKDAPRMLLERDLSFIMQKCGKISSNTIDWLINVYLQENNDVFNLIVNNQNNSQQKIEDIYSVLSSVPCRMALRHGADERYTYLCDWLLHQDILENELNLSECAEIFGMLCIIPSQIPNGDNTDYFHFLVKLYDFWDDYNSKNLVEKKIMECVRNSFLLQKSYFYYCKFNANIVELVLREKYEEAYEKIKATIEKKNYFEEQFLKENVELGQNIAAILQDDMKFVYMNKQMIKVLMTENMEKAMVEIDEWLKILPDDEELLKMQEIIMSRKIGNF